MTPMKHALLFARRTRRLGVLLALAGAACNSSPPIDPGNGEAAANGDEPAAADLDTAARDLVAAAPANWSAQLVEVAAHGAAAGPALVAAIDRNRAGPGAAPAVALLGRIGDDEAGAFLLGLVADRGALALEAALALGHLTATADLTAMRQRALVTVANDRFADPGVRTAAACSAIRLGARAEVAALVRGVLLAGTPTGRELQQELGLPLRPRWAYERYLIQRMLRDVNPELPGFDTDAPWADLQAAADRITAWLRGS